MHTPRSTLDALERFLVDEQSTIDMMLVFAQGGLGQRPLTTALDACGDLAAPWQREQASEVLSETLEHIARVVDEEYGEDWDDETRTKYEDLIASARRAIDALAFEL